MVAKVSSGSIDLCKVPGSVSVLVDVRHMNRCDLSFRRGGGPARDREPLRFLSFGNNQKLSRGSYVRPSTTMPG